MEFCRLITILDKDFVKVDTEASIRNGLMLNRRSIDDLRSIRKAVVSFYSHKIRRSRINNKPTGETINLMDKLSLITHVIDKELNRR